jgi:hypothetical protein
MFNVIFKGDLKFNFKMYRGVNFFKIGMKNFFFFIFILKKSLNFNYLNLKFKFYKKNNKKITIIKSFAKYKTSKHSLSRLLNRFKLKITLPILYNIDIFSLEKYFYIIKKNNFMSNSIISINSVKFNLITNKNLLNIDVKFKNKQ